MGHYYYVYLLVCVDITDHLARFPENNVWSKLLVGFHGSPFRCLSSLWRGLVIIYVWYVLCIYIYCVYKHLCIMFNNIHIFINLSIYVYWLSRYYMSVCMYINRVRYREGESVLLCVCFLQIVSAMWGIQSPMFWHKCPAIPWDIRTMLMTSAWRRKCV